jgi:hypothetical protein
MARRQPCVIGNGYYLDLNQPGIMIYLLIALVIGLALAPLLHFLPSKRQRALASLREAAAVGGLFVEFRDLPESGSPERRPPAAERQLIYYGLRLPPSRGKESRSGAWVWGAEDGWRAARGRAAVPPILLEMPAEILAASVDEGSCGVYWRESGDVDTVHTIRRLLGLWAEQV